MSKRLFWLAVGVGVTAVVVLKGRELYERFTPKGVVEQIERTRSGLFEWAGEFLATMGEAMDEREEELRDALGLDE